MKEARQIYKILLIVALAVYVIGTSVIMSDLYHKVGQIEHNMMHSGAKSCH